MHVELQLAQNGNFTTAYLMRYTLAIDKNKKSNIHFFKKKKK